MLKENQRVLFVKDGMVRKGVIWELGLLDVCIRCPDYNGLVVVNRGQIAEGGITESAIEHLEEQDVLSEIEYVQSKDGSRRTKHQKLIKYRTTTSLEMVVTDELEKKFFPNGINDITLVQEMNNKEFQKELENNIASKLEEGYYIQNGNIQEKHLQVTRPAKWVNHIS